MKGSIWRHKVAKVARKILVVDDASLIRNFGIWGNERMVKEKDGKGKKEGEIIENRCNENVEGNRKLTKNLIKKSERMEIEKESEGNRER